MPGVEQDQQWHLDKRVPIALIFTIIGQTILVVWVAASMYNRIEVLERQVMNYAPQGDRIVRLETRMESIQDGIQEIKAMIRGRASQ